MQQIEFRAMGCQMLAVIDSDLPQACHALQQVQGWFIGWENIFSRFRADSELSQLNAHSGQLFEVSEPLWQVIQHALNAARNSNGLITPTVLDALKLAGYDRSFEDICQNKLNKDVSQTQVSDWGLIECNSEKRAILLPKGVHLDLGGIAKGWCADQAVQKLSVIAPALIDAGGDIAISGAMGNDEAWHIAVANPFNPDTDIEQIQVNITSGIATSGRDFRTWTLNGIHKHHIIDPRTSQPAQTDIMSATVITHNAVEAEAAAKVVFILGSKAGIAWIEKHNHLSALIVKEDQSIVMSKGFYKLCVH